MWAIRTSGVILLYSPSLVSISTSSLLKVLTKLRNSISFTVHILKGKTMLLESFIHKPQRYADQKRYSEERTRKIAAEKENEPKRYLDSLKRHLDQYGVSISIHYSNQKNGEDEINWESDGSFSDEKIEEYFESIKKRYQTQYHRGLSVRSGISSEAEDLNSRIDNEGGLDKAVRWGIHVDDIKNPKIREAWAALEDAITRLNDLGVGYRVRRW